MSFMSRFHADASNACTDLYSNWILGDDAGKSASITLVLRPQSLRSRKARLDLGMTFLEINGRAYVNAVAPGSPAALAGVLPQDAVQYATVFRPEWLENHEVMTPDAASHLAVDYALDCESKGLRISYDQLRNLLAEAMDPTQSAFLSPPTSAKNPLTKWSGPPIPSNICVPVDHAISQDGYIGMSSPFSGEAPRPVVFVFRRTRQRKAIHLGLPSFRLDDECDFATLLMKRLAPTADMENPPPDVWEELVHEGTDWLLGNGSMLPPKYSQKQNSDANDNDDPAIPYDNFEKTRQQKLAHIRSRMAAEAMRDRTEDVEAATIRGMIQKAVGLAFVRASKVVLGVSLHAGSGIIIARLSDGTWSAPSAIGTWGIGLGLQFGLEVAEYIFILQTQEALDHFRHGGSFTVGGNMGLAVAGLGREAYGAASVGAACGSTSTVKDDEYNDSDAQPRAAQSMGIAPIVAYAKSQGFYVGVSLEGSRIFSREDINSRTYKFSAGRDVSAYDILSGKVPTPPEAEELYAALHSVEFTHEMSCLPRPPEVLRKDSANAWNFDRSTLGQSSTQTFAFLSSLSKEETEECDVFEAQFKNFLYGGVSVQRLLPDTSGRSGRTGRERRTLWLMLPEIGSLRLGFVSKLSDGDGAVSNKSSTLRSRREDPSKISGLDGDIGTVGSEEVTLDSAIVTKDGNSTIGPIRTGNVELSSKHSVALTDVTLLSQESACPIRLKGDDKMEHLRVISIQDASGTSLLFLANNFREAELLVCGLKLLLERESTRLGVRGGVPLSTLGGKSLNVAMSPSAARGYRDLNPGHESPRRRKNSRSDRSVSSSASSHIAEDLPLEEPKRDLPDARRRWGDVPGRQYMRVQAASSFGDHSGDGVPIEKGVPKYFHGKEILRDIVRSVRLPLPLPLCRVLLLDSTSPVIQRWENDRGDKNFAKTRWAFPPATPRELERHSSEHQLIASGSMHGAQRTSTFDRPRYGSFVRLSETHVVEADDAKKVAFSVTERNPRRGFSVKVWVTLREAKNASCDANVSAELRPVGKDMSNQAAVHKAFLLVLDEIQQRYGVEGDGLLAGFLSVVDDMAKDTKSSGSHEKQVPRPFSKTVPGLTDEKKVDGQPSKERPKNESGLVSFSDMLNGSNRQSPETVPAGRPATPSLLHQIPEVDSSKRVANKQVSILDSEEVLRDESSAPKEKEPVMIQVKPLPKIRLSLLPAPREEDEDISSAGSPLPSKPVKKKKSPRLSKEQASSTTTSERSTTSSRYRS